MMIALLSAQLRNCAHRSNETVLTPDALVRYDVGVRTC